MTMPLRPETPEELARQERAAREMFEYVEARRAERAAAERAPTERFREGREERGRVR